MTHEKRPKSFTRNDSERIIEAGENPSNLDNFNNANEAHTTVQTTREITTSNGCIVTLIFPGKGRKDARRRIAEMFIAALEKGKDEA
jgi:hypothetical protein